MGIDDRDRGGNGPSGEPSGFTCPECGGTLYERRGEKLDHFRCRTGHAYSPESLLAQQAEALEATLWAALRSLEENAALTRRMEKRSRDHGRFLDWVRAHRDHEWREWEQRHNIPPPPPQP